LIELDVLVNEIYYKFQTKFNLMKRLLSKAMKFKISNVSSGSTQVTRTARSGRLVFDVVEKDGQDGESLEIETPTAILSTQTGSVPHLTQVQ